ncbi:hypothetical protein ACH5RR_009532 [Cinchona calisaya]|uniref:Leucine-rich repeat-containing N-terminal plant-type domain-containing protein n=1 Tax=Cinchona calisaya TaxID=153742 RepID=A0ABD3AEE8_9GENT
MWRQISFHSRLLLFLVLLQAHQVLTSILLEDHHRRCHHDERLALLQFKKTFNKNASFLADCDFYGQPAYPKMISWNAPSTKDCCKWDGVTCDKITGHIIGLDLSCSCLQGVIRPNSSLFGLSHLQRLNLAQNDFTGSQISPEFGSLRGLTHLNLSSSNFDGEIPSEILHLSNLVSLDLSGTYRYFSPYVRNEPCNFETKLQNLTNLRVLSLARVEISSKVTFINLSSSLTYLDLSSTGLFGNFPSNVFHLPDLQVLLLDSNTNLAGALPKFNCTSSNSLKQLDLSSTSFSGVLPDSIGCLNSLNSLDLEECQFSGAIPESISNLTELTSLDLHSNFLVGQFPISLHNLTLLSYLDLSNNQLKGQIQDFKSRSLALTWINLSHNMLTGSIPRSIFTHPDIFYVDLSSNSFHGIELNEFQNISYRDLYYLGLSSCGIREFPDFVRNSEFLGGLDLSCNEIHGRIPTWFISKEWDDLEYLNVSRNFLTSTVDQLSCKNLMFLDMSSNFLQGQLPSSLCNFSFLKILDLSNNDFVSTIPQCLGNSSNQLNVIHLGNNRLFGSIPTTFSEDNTLHILILNDNQFEENRLLGRIPRGRHFDTFENNSYGGNLALCGFPLTKDCEVSHSPSPPLGFEEEYESDFFDGFTWKAVLLGYGCGLVLGLAMGCLMFLIGKPRWFIHIVDRTCNLRKRPRKWIHIGT